ncbi:MAG: helix-turn-helix transcriptional regulator [Clostridia bacterium]|nr:helix-turn-helix transcriptional regulator [Clostridia bacterium]
MPTGFARTLMLLRKERGISQKQAAAALDISQALLSHYEKGIRECRLEFVVRAADYYNVSCDYLLGRTPDKSGAMLTVDDLPDGEPNAKDGRAVDNMLPVLNKKLTLNAISVLFDILKRCKHKELTAEVSEYLNLAIYTVFRSLYAANTKNPNALFALPETYWQPVVNGEMGIGAAHIRKIAREAFSESKAPSMLPDALAKAYPLLASSLMNVLKNAEESIEQ